MAQYNVALALMLRGEIIAGQSRWSDRTSESNSQRYAQSLCAELPGQMGQVSTISYVLLKQLLSGES
jgi:hypothetical protein